MGGLGAGVETPPCGRDCVRDALGYRRRLQIASCGQTAAPASDVVGNGTEKRTDQGRVCR